MKITKRNDDNQRKSELSIRDPFRNVFSLRDAMDRLFDESFWSPFSLMERGNQEMQSFLPRVDVSETDNEVKIRADIPGIDPDKVNIEVSEDSIHLSGSVEKSNEEKGENYYRMERQSGQFSREFILPSKVDTNSVDAKAKNGVITINLKKQPSEQKKKVQVKAE